MSDEERLKDLVATLMGIAKSEVGPNTSMDTVESWSSLRHMDLILAVEEEFGITIPDDEAANLTSFPLLSLVVGELREQR